MAADSAEVRENKIKGHSSLVGWKPTRMFAESFSCPVSEKCLEKSLKEVIDKKWNFISF